MEGGPTHEKVKKEGYISLTQPGLMAPNSQHETEIDKSAQHADVPHEQLKVTDSCDTSF